MKTPTDFFSISGFAYGNIISIDKWNIDTSNVTRIDFMFKECKKLKQVDLRGFNTSNVTSMAYLFTNCTSLVSVDLRGLNTSNVTSMEELFSNCTSLVSVDLSDFNTINVANMRKTFKNCNNLTELDLRAFDATNCSDLNMFEGSYNINKLYLSSNFFNSKRINSYYFHYLHYWTDPESLAMFVEAITAHNVIGKEVYLANETKSALTQTQKDAIRAKGWAIL